MSGTPDSLRDSKNLQKFLAYKNEENTNPMRVDLSNGCMQSACPMLRKVREWGEFGQNGARFGQASRYERTVISLKKGDTVVFGNHEFKLGEFLGAGNATHIYALENKPNEVIRIPILVPGAPIWSIHDFPETQDGRLKHIRYLIQKYANSALTDPFLAPVILSDPEGRFLVVKRVYGTQTGADFLDAVVRKAGRSQLYLGESLTWDQLMVESLEAELQKKCMGLLELLRSDGKVGQYSGDGGKATVIYFGTITTRQYLWDEIDKKWVKIDIE